MIYLVTADYRNPPVAPPYGVEADSAQEAKRWFQRCFPILRVFSVEPLPQGHEPPLNTMRKRDEGKKIVSLIQDAHEGLKVADAARTVHMLNIREQIIDCYHALEKLEAMVDTLENDLYVNRKYVDGRLIDFLDKVGGKEDG